MVRCRTAFGVTLSLLLFLSITAHAQLGIYATVTGERVTGFTCADPQGQCAASGGTVRPYGGTFGGYYDFRSIGPIKLGVDLRGSVLNSNKSATTSLSSTDSVRHYSVLGGVRAGFNTPIRWLHPYAQISGGYGRTNAASTNPTVYSEYGQVQAFAGADIQLLQFLDLRLVELGAGELFGSNSHSIQSVGAGVVFHLPR